MSEEKSQRRVIDWERIEVEYRAGVLSLRELGAAYSVAHVTIAKRAKRDGWERDLSAKIKAKVEFIANTHLANSDANSKIAVTEKEIIEASASAIIQIKERHHKQIGELQDIGDTLTKELKTCGDELAKKASIYKMIADTRKSLIGVEREAYGIDGKSGDDTDIESAIKKLINVQG